MAPKIRTTRSETIRIWMTNFGSRGRLLIAWW